MNQKDEEKLVMGLFRKAFPDFPKGRLIASESPDFMLKLNRRQTIGIELIRLDLNHPDIFTSIVKGITAKNQKLSIYQKKILKAVWLIMYTEDTGIITRSNFLQKLEKIPISSGYSCLFLFDLFTQKIYPVTTTGE
jgi:hypothetical protein